LSAETSVARWLKAYVNAHAREENAAELATPNVPAFVRPFVVAGASQNTA
jgi:hypothetical protein